MGFANFHSRATMAASQVLQGFDTNAFTELLEQQLVGVAFDGSAIASADARATVELSVSLLARLYPRIALVPLDRAARAHVDQFATIAHDINPSIELFSGSRRKLASCIVVGTTGITPAWNPVYVGSDGWLVRLSPERPAGTATQHHPFSAGAAACFGVANVFRRTFYAQLPDARPDGPLELSLFSYERNSTACHASLGPVNFHDVHLVGLGAIGNGAVWALSRLPSARGTIHLIDHEAVELSNLQRYILTRQESIGRNKVELAKEVLEPTELDVVPHVCRWEDYTAQHNDWCFEQVAVAVDTPEDRIGIQAALPRWIVNAWTQPGDLGVSRHDFLGSQACLACLYLPDHTTPSEDELVAAALGLKDELMEIRQRLYRNTPVDRQFLDRIAEGKRVPVTELLQFEGQPLRTFYTQVVCGGVIFALTKGAATVQVPVPLPFQSALAGILLANDLVCHAQGYERSLPVRTSIDLLRPLGTYLSTPHAKPPTRRCICQDDDYEATYRQKYSN